MRYMDPVIISPSVQLFAGARYYLCGRYFQHRGRRLHRAVWEAEHGRLPAGKRLHLHHRNNDRSDNRLENLELKTARKHLADHARQVTDKQRRARSANATKYARAGNAKLSGESRSVAASRGWSAREPVAATCAVCGRPFPTFRPEVARFCGGTCRARDLRRRRREAGLTCAGLRPRGR